MLIECILCGTACVQAMLRTPCTSRCLAIASPAVLRRQKVRRQITAIACWGRKKMCRELLCKYASDLQPLSLCPSVPFCAWACNACLPGDCVYTSRCACSTMRLTVDSVTAHACTHRHEHTPRYASSPAGHDESETNGTYEITAGAVTTDVYATVSRGNATPDAVPDYVHGIGCDRKRAEAALRGRSNSN